MRGRVQAHVSGTPPNSCPCNRSPPGPCTPWAASQGPLFLQVWKGKSSPSKGNWVQNGCKGGECPPGVLITAGELPAIRAHSLPPGKGQRGETKSGRCQWDTGHAVTNSRDGVQEHAWCRGHTYLQVWGCCCEKPRFHHQGRTTGALHVQQHQDTSAMQTPS